MVKRQCLHCLICFEIKSRNTPKKNRREGVFCSTYCYQLSRKPIKSNINICKYCGFLFVGLKKQLCSDNCRKSLARDKSYARDRLRNNKPLVVCKQCGISFIAEYGTKKRVFCSIKCAGKFAHRKKHGMYKKRIKKVSLEFVDPYKVMKRDGYRCKICGIETPLSKRGKYEPDSPEIDHMIPLGKGGFHAYINVQLLCRSCNALKSDSLTFQNFEDYVYA